jgi:hypothetical protein
VVNALQGRLGDGVLANLVQYLSLNQASGCLQLGDEDRASGRIFLRGGSVEHVEAAALVGLPALTELLRWRRGHFAFTVGALAPLRTLDLPVDALLLQASFGSDLRDNGRPARAAPAPNGAQGALGAVAGRAGGGVGAARGPGAVDPGANGVLAPTPLADPALASGLAWAAVTVAGPIGEIFVDEAFQSIGHSPRLLPESALGALVEALAGHFKTAEGRRQFLSCAEAVLAHHGYGRVEGER